MLIHRTLLLQLLLAASLGSCRAALNPLRNAIKLLDIRCKSRSPQLLSFEQCFIQRSATDSQVSTLCHIEERPLRNITIRVQCFRKRPHGYAPFVLDLTLDWCRFLDRRANELMRRMFAIIEHSSNFNTKCPVDMDTAFLNFSLPRDGVFQLPFKFPVGVYRVDLRVRANAAIQVDVNTFFEIE